MQFSIFRQLWLPVPAQASSSAQGLATSPFGIRAGNDFVWQPTTFSAIPRSPAYSQKSPEIPPNESRVTAEVSSYPGAVIAG